MHKPTIVTNGRFFVSVETRRSSNDIDFAVKFDPNNKPPKDTKAWKDAQGRNVFIGPDGRWRLESARQELLNRISKNYNAKNANKKNYSLTEQVHNLSEKVIGDALVSNGSSREEALKTFKNNLEKSGLDEKNVKSWYESSIKSINAIENYTNNFLGKKILKYRHVGAEKKIDKKFGTADIIITLNDGKELGISLKKEGDARLFNSSINKQDLGKNYIKNQQTLLKEVAKRNGKNVKNSLSRSEAKKIKEEFGNQKVSGNETLNEVLDKNHKDFKKKALQDAESIISNNNLLGKIDSVLSNIREGSLIIVSGDKIVDKDSLKKLSGADTSNLNTQFIDEKNKGRAILLKYGDLALAKIGIRQDGIGYGNSIKLEANFTQEFIRKLKKDD